METLRTLIDTLAETQSNAVYLIAPESGNLLSYQELQSHCKKIAFQFASLGLSKGDKVAFLLDNGVWTASLFLGTQYAGRTIVPLNAIAGPDQLAYVLDHSDCKLLFISEHYLEKYSAILAPRQIQIILTSEDSGPVWPDQSHEASITNLPVLTAEDVGILIYTSGTTGLPKGVLLSHENAIAGGRNTAGAHHLSASDRALCVLPLYHINAQMVSIMASLVSAGSVVLPHQYSSSLFWDWIIQQDCTWFSVVPTIIAYLLEMADRNELVIKLPATLRFGRSASAPLSPQLHQAFEQRFGIPLIETMGLTETAAQILSNPMPPALPCYGSPGVAYGNEAKIINPDGHDLAAGEAGELMIRGCNVMKAYYKDPAATRKAFNASGWLHTGDLAYRNSEGFFFITGRLKELIIKGGENIAPREIDEVLYQHPAVLEAAAFAIPDALYGQEVRACVALKPGMICSEAELVTLCIKRLGSFKAPKKITILASLPKGPSGKIQRLKLHALVLETEKKVESIKI